MAEEALTPSHHGPSRQEVGSARRDDPNDEACSVNPFTNTTASNLAVITKRGTVAIKQEGDVRINLRQGSVRVTGVTVEKQ